jgi:hypothetical protein
VPMSDTGDPTVINRAFLRGLLNSQASFNRQDGLKRSAREHGGKSRLSIKRLNPVPD